MPAEKEEEEEEEGTGSEDEEAGENESEGEKEANGKGGEKTAKTSGPAAAKNKGKVVLKEPDAAEAKEE